MKQETLIRNGEVQKLNKEMNGRTEAVDHHLQAIKIEVGNQMHEMCTMVEEIAQMAKTLEI